jgi:hypothetical protein
MFYIKENFEKLQDAHFVSIVIVLSIKSTHLKIGHELWGNI